MKVDDQFYPTIGITTKATVEEDPHGFRWMIQTHVAGPDELIRTKSDLFLEKSKCTVDLLSKYCETVNRQLEELFQ